MWEMIQISKILKVFQKRTIVELKKRVLSTLTFKLVNLKGVGELVEIYDCSNNFRLGDFLFQTEKVNFFSIEIVHIHWLTPDLTWANLIKPNLT